MDEYRQESRAFIFNKSGNFIFVNAKSYSSGVFSAPKGGLKKGETSLDAIHRELLEELNLQKADYTILRESEVTETLIYPADIANKAGQRGSKIKSFWIKLDNIDNLAINTEEINSMKYIDSNELFEYFNIRFDEKSLRKLSEEYSSLKKDNAD